MKKRNNKKMNYFCKTQKQGGEGLSHSYPNTDRVSNPTSVYPKTGVVLDCPLLNERVNYFRTHDRNVTTLLGGLHKGCQLLW